MNIFKINDEKLIPDKIYEYTKNVQESQIPLVIDNGSYQCRVGWSTVSEPMLIFRNLIAKPRKDRVKKDSDAGTSKTKNKSTTTTTTTQAQTTAPSIQIGNDIVNFETIRYQLKTQFDRNVVTHYQNQEHIYDHIFTHLGINTNGFVGHPIVLTECFANPNYYRQLMSELLFECYQVPSLCYGIDSIYSFYHNGIGQNGLIISCGYHTTHIIPILNGIVEGRRTRRLNIGGYHMITYLHRLLQLKYPVHAASLTLTRIEWLLHNHCTIAYDYLEDLKKWTDINYYDDNIKKIQLPYNTAAVNANQLTAEQKLEKKREMAKRLADLNARRREAKLIEDQDLLQRLQTIRDTYDDDDEQQQNERQLQRALKEHGITNIDELLKQIVNTTKRIERTKQKIEQSANATCFPFEVEKPTSTATNIPKPPANIEITDWIKKIKQLRGQLLEKRMVRLKRKQDLTKRRTAAAQERMRIISQLARKETRKEKASDDFGMRDADWDVYKRISRERWGGDSDSETENEKLLEYEEILRHHDPTFEDPSVIQPEICDPEELHQLHVGIEAIRAPELLFQPSMIGIAEGGLGESIDYVLKLFTPAEQLLLVNNVFLTGGCSKFPGLEKRLSRELLTIRPFKSEHKIIMSKNGSTDGWYGARTFAENAVAGNGAAVAGSHINYGNELPNNNNQQYFVTRQMYDEFGGDYLKEYYASNKYCPTVAAPTVVNATSNI